MLFRSNTLVKNGKGVGVWLETECEEWGLVKNGLDDVSRDHIITCLFGFFNEFIYLFMATLGLCCCVQAFL